jgi:hypothetical protein
MMSNMKVAVKKYSISSHKMLSEHSHFIMLPSLPYRKYMYDEYRDYYFDIMILTPE